MSSRELDIAKLEQLRVVDLKGELSRRGLSQSGVKRELVQRLRNHLEAIEETKKFEQEQEEQRQKLEEEEEEEEEEQQQQQQQQQQQKRRKLEEEEEERRRKLEEEEEEQQRKRQKLEEEEEERRRKLEEEERLRKAEEEERRRKAEEEERRRKAEEEERRRKAEEEERRRKAEEEERRRKAEEEERRQKVEEEKRRRKVEEEEEEQRRKVEEAKQGDKVDDSAPEDRQEEKQPGDARKSDVAKEVKQASEEAGEAKRHSEVERTEPGKASEDDEDEEEGVELTTRDEDVVKEDEDEEERKQDSSPSTATQETSSTSKDDEDKVPESPAVKFRTLGGGKHQNGGQQHRKRQWGSLSKEKEAGIITSQSLKDIVPDVAPLLEKEDADEDEEETVEMKVKAEDEAGIIQEARLEEEEEEGEIAKKPHLEETTATKDEGRCFVRITNLVRPFTVNQLKALLARTGNVDDDFFFLNKIKSECVARYTNAAAAEETAAALDGVSWPQSNPKRLCVRATDEAEYGRIVERETGGKAGGAVSAKQPRQEEPERRPRPKKTSGGEELKETPPKSLEELFNKTKTVPNLYWKMVK